MTRKGTESGCLAQSSGDKNYIAKHIRETAMRRMRFWPRCESSPYLGPRWFSNLGVRMHFVIKMLGKAVLESPNWAGHRCKRPAFQSLLCHLLALELGQVI